MQKAIKGCLLGAAALAMPLAGMAADADWYVNPQLGYTVFDKERGLEDEAGVAGFGIEKVLSKDWAVELRALQADPDLESNGDVDVDMLRVHLDAIRYLPSSGKAKPYLAFGIGHSEFEMSNNGVSTESEETDLNAGAGVRYIVDENWSVRGDVRYVYATDSELSDGIATLALSYAIGGSEPAPAAEPAPKAQPVEAPKASDSDRDGVMDADDRCPGTPYRIAVDASGCPLDNDGDGVPNYRDRCPGTPAGTKVDYRGCEQVSKQVEQVKLVVNFAFDSAVVARSYADEIRKVADFLKSNPSINATIEGHTDEIGSSEYNQDLSERRASSVKDILVKQHGIAANRIATEGYGERRPVASNKTDAGRQANRRASAVIKVQAK